MNTGNNCKKIVIATTDEKLYKHGSIPVWNFPTNIYVGVKCIHSNQTTISDNVIGTDIDFHKLTKLPYTFEYCDAHTHSNCSNYTVVFTTNPSSTKTDDYLQFVYTADGSITDSPHHSLKTRTDGTFNIEIVDIDFDAILNETSIWIQGSKLTGALKPIDVDFDVTRENNTFFIALVGVSVVILLFLIIHLAQ